MVYKQRVAKIIGSEGCYFLSLIYIAEKITGRTVDVIGCYEDCLKRGYIKEDCFINDPARIIKLVTGKTCTFHRVDGEHYEAKANEHVIALWERPGYKHFVVMGEDKVEYDPLGESQTVKRGRITGYRVIRL